MVGESFTKGWSNFSTEIKEQYGKDYLSEGLTKMAEILGKDQVVHDSWAFCTMGRMMAKRAMTEVPGDIGAQHLESACIEMQEKMLTALAEKMKSCNKGDKETVNKVLTELSKDFSPDTVRQSVIDRAKDLKRQHTEKCEKILDLYQKLHKDIDGGEHNLESLTDKQRHDVAEIINRHFEPGSVEESNLKSVEKTTIERDTLRSAKQEVEAYIERESGSTGPPENKRDTNEKDENLFTKL